MELEQIIQRKRERFKYKNTVLQIGALVTVLASLLPGILYLAKLVDELPTFMAYVFGVNLILETVVTYMVIVAVRKISKIYGMLPSHIKHSKIMIWTHIILFSLMIFFSLALLIGNIIEVL